MELKQLARYPFLKVASEYVRANSVSLEELLGNGAFEPARRRGYQRVLDALNGANVTRGGVSAEEHAVLNEVLSYPVARILVSCIADDFLIRRYAIAESKMMNDQLRTDDVPVLMEVAEDLGVSAHLEGDQLGMHFCDFLRYTAAIRGKDWKLINQEVREGFIQLKKDKFARVLEQALNERIENDLPLPVSDEVMRSMAPEVERLMALVVEMREKFRANDFGQISVTKFPPCMKALLTMAEKGQNMPHAGRFALVTFLGTLGMSKAEIAGTFYTSPDFDKSKTEYQVEHIIGDGP
ncbi:MAG TPA: DNA primase large subunit PriL, partial [Methanomassiliicoccales archaeon]|nr:DNA primase large subunit PriL [Methanomassiliicoccales archaeon]